MTPRPSEPPPLPSAWTVDELTRALRVRARVPETAPDLTQYGWALQLLEDDMRLDDVARARDHALPRSCTVRTWSDAVANDAYDVYVASFLERPGFPDWSREQWLTWATGYETFRPGLSHVVYGDDDAPLAYAVGALEPDACWVVQMGVVPDQRRKGIARALLERTRAAAHAAGATVMQLAVNENNPGARSLYQAFGFRFDARRAVYRHTPVD